MTAGEFRRDHDQFNDEIGKDESASESLLMTQHVAGSLANFFPSQESVEDNTNTTEVSELNQNRGRLKRFERRMNVDCRSQTW